MYNIKYIFFSIKATFPYTLQEEYGYEWRKFLVCYFCIGVLIYTNADTSLILSQISLFVQLIKNFTNLT